MGKIALLVSREEMLHQAHNILQESDYKIEKMKLIHTEDAIVEARQAIAEGASIIIARGLQASLIKQYTDIPVVEIVMTAQEMALLVTKAKQILKKSHPVIGVVGTKNMFCDMSYFDVLYDIELRTYYEKGGRDFKQAAERAADDHVDLIIGGNTAIEVAGTRGIPSLFLSMTEDAIRTAFIMAEHMDYAMETEKKNAAQIETLLDYASNGVMRLDRTGAVISVNPVMKQLLGQEESGLAGKKLSDIFHEISREALEQVMEKGEENCSWFLQAGQTAVLATLALVRVEGRVEGAVFTCHRMKKKTPEAPKKQDRNPDLIALGDFRDILQLSSAMQECVRRARLYSISEKPVLLKGETGTELRLLAQGIHNSSLRSAGPFLAISCQGMGEEEQRQRLFGDNGGLTMVNGGTLFLEDGEFLSLESQYHLYEMIYRHVRMGDTFVQKEHVNVRLIFASACSLKPLAEHGRFRKDLFYLLEGLTLEVPPLRKRKEDLKKRISLSFDAVCEKYSRYHVLTGDGWDAMMEYPWPGNILQVESFVERLVLTAGKRSLDGMDVKVLLNELYPEPLGLGQANLGQADFRQAGLGQEEVEQAEALERLEGDYYRKMAFPEEKGKIREALERNRGSREKTAEELGISKPTLWRKMKKYGLK